MTQSNHSVIAT